MAKGGTVRGVCAAKKLAALTDSSVFIFSRTANTVLAE
jgi:hypothetical protein